MHIHSAKFLGSYNTYEGLPQSTLPEMCFIGRSNVGKSSLINYLLSRSGLAKVSATPGKTQSFNYYLVNQSWHLVDLPGYGYAKKSKTLRTSWETTMKKYFVERETLYNVFVLIDSRISPQQIDLEYLEFLGQNQVPFSIIFTKADKREYNKCKANIKQFLDTIAQYWETLPPNFVTSSNEYLGADEIKQYLSEILKL